VAVEGRLRKLAVHAAVVGLRRVSQIWTISRAFG